MLPLKTKLHVFTAAGNVRTTSLDVFWLNNGYHCNSCSKITRRALQPHTVWYKRSERSLRV